jgi:quercetin dioxygenase-like cupin family protein
MSIVSAGTVEPLSVLGDRVGILLRSADSAHRMTAMTVEVPPGSGVPPHSHAVEEEGYFVLEGVLEMTVGGRTASLSRGDFAHVPPTAVHGYRNVGDVPARFLAWTVGGPIDEFFEAMSRDVRRMPDDAAAMHTLMQRFGIRAEVPPCG